MRFLHTADWHVGKALRGRSRMDEHAAALDQVLRVALEARVDAVLVAGDVFDSSAPPPEAEKLVYDLLARLAAARIACVVIAGNHDHPRRLAAVAALLERLGVHVRAEVRPPADGGIVRLASRDGSEEARIAVLPFVPERRVVDACQVMGPEQSWYDEYARRVAQMLGALAQPLTPATVNVVLAHLLVDGARAGTGERELHLAELYGVGGEQLPCAMQYIALGHLHRAQELAAPSPTRYSGSLIELDFGERDEQKRVVVFEASPGRPAAIEWVPVTAGRRLREVLGTLDELVAMADSVADALLRVTVRADSPIPGLAERVKELLPNALEVRLELPPRAHDPVRENGTSGRGLDPARLFALYYERRHGRPPSSELEALFRDLHDEVTP